MANFCSSFVDEPFLSIIDTFILSQNIKIYLFKLVEEILSRSSTQDVSSLKVELVKASVEENFLETNGSDVQDPK